eukprot:593297-Alexandrium_andersonii.AAC.1
MILILTALLVCSFVGHVSYFSTNKRCPDLERYGHTRWNGFETQLTDNYLNIMYYPDAELYEGDEDLD